MTEQEMIAACREWARIHARSDWCPVLLSRLPELTQSERPPHPNRGRGLRTRRSWSSDEMAVIAEYNDREINLKECLSRLPTRTRAAVLGMAFRNGGRLPKPR